MGKEEINNTFAGELRHRVLLLDGSTGVMLQRRGLTENEIRGRRFLYHPYPLSSNLDILSLSRPDIVAGIHREYLEAGADIIETNSFNANVLSQKEYGTADLVREINLSAARIARREADRATAMNPERPRYVAGAMGPTARSASLPVDVDNPEARSIDFVTLADVYYEQAAALIEGGVDMLLIETVFDPLNAKAAATGAVKAFTATGREVPLIFSLSLSDSSGRLLTGHTPEAFLAAIAHFNPIAVGFNCSAGPAGLAGAVRSLAEYSSFATIFYPNAGLPDQLGAYSLDSDGFAGQIRPLLADGILNIVGGCCGTTPEHISLLRSLLDSGNVRMREIPDVHPAWIAGLDPIGGSPGFINVGERCNVAGSRRFLRLIKEKNYQEALEIARRQVLDGAMVIDINMDDAMLDAQGEMVRFLRILGSDPVASSVPWMIDSSDFRVIESALGNVAGKGIVNSISLRDGEEEFLRQAHVIAGYGAAVVVMLFDEHGQATTFERKVEIAARAYSLLTEQCGFEPRDIIIDANILTVATGMRDHDRYALDYIRAVEWISDNLPGVHTSGGVSNLSFAFRGNSYLRQAMHAVFLYHAVRAGLTMAIMDPSSRVSYTDLSADLLDRIEDVIFCRRADASDRLTEIATRYSGIKGRPQDDHDMCRSELSVSERLARALRAGETMHLEADLREALVELGSAQRVVDGPLMSGMEEVGRLFSCGKLFLPQVVKSARTMREAVGILFPAESDTAFCQESMKGRMLMATVRGDVHDIGKNIAAVVMRCNNYEVVDLGVQVEASAIVEAALRMKPDFIGLSGLITPSLAEMVKVAEALCMAGVNVPLFVGGAATTELHTALRLAPAYGDGLVVRMTDASANPIVAARLGSDYAGEAEAIKCSQRKLAEDYLQGQSKQKEPEFEKPKIDWSGERIDNPSFKGVRTLPEIPVGEVAGFINYTYFFKCWQVCPDSEEAGRLKEDAEALLGQLVATGATMRAQIAFYEAYAVDDRIVIDGNVILPAPRQKPREGRSVCMSLSDFIAPEGYEDHIGCFVVTIGEKIREMLSTYGSEGDDYRILLLQSLSDRLAEACSEWLHLQVRRTYWGYSPDEPGDAGSIRRAAYRGIRPAVGYPSLPDQMAMHTLMKLLRQEAVGVSVTSNGALLPASSVAGFYFASPRARYFTLG